jgi:glycosyltransferase involved in cell wall biosynthesis
MSSTPSSGDTASKRGIAAPDRTAYSMPLQSNGQPAPHLPLQQARNGLPAPTPPRRWPGVRKVSIVIPALNEEQNIREVVSKIPRRQLAQGGCDLELIVVDNASTDRTAEVASEMGATVVEQPERGYGNAYTKGFSVANGDVIVTGDADCTYPFDLIPALLDHLSGARLEFLTTNRLGRDNRDAMKRSHAIANHLLTAASRGLLGAPFRDSQSGMWVFERSIWGHLDVRSSGMPFSQEIKNEAWLKGFRCGEVQIEYRRRGGEVKLNAVRDGVRNLWQLTIHRVRAGRRRVERASLEIIGPGHTCDALDQHPTWLEPR